MGTFTEIDTLREKLAKCHQPPDNCPVCILHDQSTSESQELPTGVARHGISYHLRDFILFRGQDGPCRIGQIDWVDFNGDYTTLKVKLLGRTATIRGSPPVGVIKDGVRGMMILIVDSS
jgi:DNA (cytosine-5)-methyltransferase 1